MGKHDPPPHLVRFYGNTGYALECIALKQITFIHIENFNDPFDPVFDCPTDCDDYETLLRHVQDHHPSDLTSFMQRFPEHNWRTAIGRWSQEATTLRKHMFVFSTCAVSECSHPRDNLYMWGHYGNGHRGVAIEFNTSALGESFTIQNDSTGNDHWWEMEYADDIPPITCAEIFEFVMNANEDEHDYRRSGPQVYSKIGQQLRTKSTVWQSEDEWRLVRENDETRLQFLRHDIPERAVAAVYLGCRAAEQEQKRDNFVHEARCHFPQAEVFRCKMIAGKYALNFEKLA